MKNAEAFQMIYAFLCIALQYKMEYSSIAINIEKVLCKLSHNCPILVLNMRVIVLINSAFASVCYEGVATNRRRSNQPKEAQSGITQSKGKQSNLIYIY